MLGFDIKEGPWESVKKIITLCRTETLKSFKKFGKIFFDDFNSRVASVLNIPEGIGYNL